MDLSTVFRRLNALESRLRVRLFDRSARGYQLTAAGERAAGAAERVETELLDARSRYQRPRPAIFGQCCA